MPVAAEVGSISGYDDDVGCSGRDLLLATGAQVRLTSLGAVDSPDFDAKLQAAGGQVGDLLEVFQLPGGPPGAYPLPAPARGRTAHSQENGPLSTLRS